MQVKVRGSAGGSRSCRETSRGGRVRFRPVAAIRTAHRRHVVAKGGIESPTQDFQFSVGS